MGWGIGLGLWLAWAGWSAPSGPAAVSQWQKDPSRWVNGAPAPKAGSVGLYFWSTSCVPCQDESQVFQAMATRWGGSARWIAVHVPRFEGERDRFTVEQGVRLHGLRTPVYRDRGRARKDFRLDRLPAFHFWHGGRLRVTASTLEQWRELPARLAPLLGKPDSVEPSPPVGGPLRFPEKVILGPEGDHSPWALLADTGNHRILGVSLAPGREGSIVWESGQRGRAGWRDGNDPLFSSPRGLQVDGETLLVADTGNHRIRRIHFKSGKVETVVGSGQVTGPSVVRGASPLSLSLHAPWDVAPLGPDRWAISAAGSHQLFRWDAKAGTVSTYAGTGTRASRDGKYPRHGFAQPSGLASHQGRLFVADALSSSLRQVQADGNVTTVMEGKIWEGGFGDGKEGALQYPLGLVSTPEGLVILDSFNHSLRRWTETPGLETLVGHPKHSVLRHPRGALPWKGRWLVADTFQHRLVWWKAGTSQWTRLLVHPPLRSSSPLERPRI